MSVRRWIGLAGLGFVFLGVIGIVLFGLAGPPPGLDPADKLVAYYRAHAALLATVILLEDISIVPLIVFAAGLRALIRQAGGATEWLGSLLFGVAVLAAAEAYVHHALIGAGIADSSGTSEPTTVRTLAEASAYMTNTPLTVVLIFFLAIAGYAVWQTRVLSRWIVWVAWVGAALVALTLPSVYGGNDASGVYTADGVVGLLALVVLYVWSACVAIVALRAPDRSVLTTES
jgi:hypothetical protein